MPLRMPQTLDPQNNLNPHQCLLGMVTSLVLTLGQWSWDPQSQLDELDWSMLADSGSIERLSVNKVKNDRDGGVGEGGWNSRCPLWAPHLWSHTLIHTF